MRLELEVSMDGSAFDNGPGPLEIARILRAAGDVLEAYPWSVDEPLRLQDINGNRVGFMLVTENEPA